MESLTEQQRAGISKMSDARLRTKLIQAGYKPGDVEEGVVNPVVIKARLKVPVELRAVLMRPYLTVHAKALLARCDISESTDYEAIKKIFAARNAFVSFGIFGQV